MHYEKKNPPCDLVIWEGRAAGGPPPAELSNTGGGVRSRLRQKSKPTLFSETLKVDVEMVSDLIFEPRKCRF